MSVASRLACTPCRVWSGLESARRFRPCFVLENESPASRKNAGPSSSSSNGSVRCQASSVALYPLVLRKTQMLTQTQNQTQGSKVETVEREADVETTETQTIEDKQAVLSRTYLAEAAVGIVECGNRGCRPVFDYPAREAINFVDDVAQVLGSRTNVFPSRTRGTEITESEPTLKVLEPVVDNATVAKAFDAALEAAPRDAKLLSQFATFKWKAMADEDAAEELFNRALEVSPDDSEILASYALYLWQSDQ